MTRRFQEPKLVLATHNPGKVGELVELLAPWSVEVVSAGDLGLPEPEETAPDFVGNARIKALAAARASGLPALSDDSGFCVAALGGDPGVYSARWGGPSKDFAAAMAEVERRLGSSADRRAWFVAVLCLAWPDGATDSFMGRVDGGDGRRRRESVTPPPRATDKLMVITEHGERDQIAVLEDDVLVEHYVTRGASTSMVGNVYLGRVQNVLPGMEAAFVDAGLDKNAFLHVAEIRIEGLDQRENRIVRGHPFARNAPSQSLQQHCGGAARCTGRDHPLRQGFVPGGPPLVGGRWGPVDRPRREREYRPHGPRRKRDGHACGAPRLDRRAERPILLMSECARVCRRDRICHGASVRATRCATSGNANSRYPLQRLYL